MNSVTILLISVIWVVTMYFFYGRRLQNRLFSPLDRKDVPARTRQDGTDFYPTPEFVLFGHHFSSIAGAGPIVGPIVAVALFGWGPSVLWLLLAGVTVGAVHDYLSLMVSVRHGGDSVPGTAKRYVSSRARMLLLVFVWFTIVLVLAVFATFSARALVSKPELVLPTFLLIPLAILFGLVQKFGRVPLWISTVTAIVGLIGLIVVGVLYPVPLTLSADTVYMIWFSLLMLYGVIASVTPVWILLQPRDYLSSWVLLIGIGLAFIGILITAPTMNAPFWSGFFASGDGKPMLPFLFIIIACGAVSGFHSLVAGGTTSKQLSRERDGLFIGFGSMLAETVIGIICVIIAGGAIRWGTDSGGLQNLLQNGSPLSVFGVGFGKLTDFVFPGTWGAVIGITIVNVFIMTTLDTSVRLARFLTGEIMQTVSPKCGGNKVLMTALPVIPAFLLGISGSWKTVWPVFGSANQLVAALVFIVLTAYLREKGKPVRYTLWATVFMLLSTLAALLWLTWQYTVRNPDPVLATFAVILIVLALLMAAEGIAVLRRPTEGGDR